MAIIISLVFVGYYVLKFFQSSLAYFMANIIYFFRSYDFYMAIMFILIMMITILFYISGYIALIYEAGREYHSNKWSKVIDRDLKIVMKRIRDYEESKTDNER